MAEQAPWCYARAQWSGYDTVLAIDTQYKQSIIYFRAYAATNGDSTSYFNGYTSILTGSAAYPDVGSADTAVEWNGWLMSRGSGTSPVVVANEVTNTRWNKYFPQADYSQDISGTIIVNQPFVGNRGSLIYDINYTKSNVGAVRSMGSGQKTSSSQKITGVQFDFDAGGSGSNPFVYIDYYIVGVK
jgi:hypothetical protein